MKRTLTYLATLLALTATANATPFDYTYAIDTVLNIPADSALTLATSNAVITNEGACAYYQPVGGNLNQAVIDFHFAFDDPVLDGQVFANFAFFNWWYGEGWGWLYGSKDGSNWTTLIGQMGPPSEGAGVYPAFDDTLPLQILGATDLYFRAVIDNTNTSGNSSNPFRNTAQFLRSSPDGVDNFLLEVNFVPEPATAGLLAVGGMALIRRRWK